MSQTQNINIDFPGPLFLSLSALLSLSLWALLFIALKLTGFIAWSWLWVTAPLWGGLALALGICLLVLLFLGAVLGITAIWNICRG